MRKYFHYTEEELIEEFGKSDVSIKEITERKQYLYKIYTTFTVVDFVNNRRVLANMLYKHGHFSIVYSINFLHNKLTIKTKTPELMTVLLLEYKLN